MERPLDVLLRTDRTLGSVIESILGAPPSLEVVSQSRLTGPLPDAVVPLGRGSGILARRTRYRSHGMVLTRNVAFVATARIDPDMASRLEAGALHLGQVFSAGPFAPLDLRFGTDRDAGDVDVLLRLGFPADATAMRPYVWRRYLAGDPANPAFLVIESLPVRTWELLLGSSASSGAIEDAAG